MYFVYTFVPPRRLNRFDGEMVFKVAGNSFTTTLTFCIDSVTLTVFWAEVLYSRIWGVLALRIVEDHVSSV